jgi:hypothetical protein
MKTRWTLALVPLFALAACAPDTEEAEDTIPAAAEDNPPAMETAPSTITDETPEIPAGYAVRLDRAGASTTEYEITAEEGGLRVTTGPAGILYERDNVVESGDYSVSATFTEIGAPADHREAFGLFIGGSDLQDEAQRYTYFLVRADGSYLIKRRDGTETPNLSDGWVSSDAVNGSPEGGDVTNELAIQVTGDQVRFSINGTEVATHPVSEIDPYGIAGVRINHNLDVRVEDFELST